MNTLINQRKIFETPDLLGGLSVNLDSQEKCDWSLWADNHKLIIDVNDDFDPKKEISVGSPVLDNVVLCLRMSQG